MTSAPKYSKVEIMLEFKSSDHRIPKIETLTFLDAGLVITGDYIIVVLDERNEANSNLTTTGKIFSLSQVKAYKTYSL
jgi:hypothetical protein